MCLLQMSKTSGIHCQPISTTAEVHVVQVQGQALMPGAAMFEMAASAAATVADAAAGSAAALLGVSIPAPLPLTTHAAAASTLLSCTLDAASGRLTVQLQAAAGGHPRLHMAASASVAPAVSALAGRIDQAAVLPSRAAAALRSVSASRHTGGTAIADLQQGVHSQAAQYNVHPAVLDCCTQVSQHKVAFCCHHCLCQSGRLAVQHSLLLHAFRIHIMQIGGAYLPSSEAQQSAAAVTRVPVGLSAYAPRQAKYLNCLQIVPA